ncbi:NAD(P)/FAD-dependent oxidoreductase [Actinobacteria bacterium YIM 96077]|uniref:NAD(P)/FAD-dependent oxidoreductase n=1 Tax=Phytoactinopolyspora halophila TaxID=1981511 RepID=A0A329QK21_9ACTN|nr:FAD-dependent oxidoreductase [Phytoactinopolyspora halophila]AYY12384.1 NAD(P)/FAD-dependent oxidoreductase [Actinobacteria bacterium YIM 96077]RAW12039.1 NAD(P)/FAD-dependent oxidoreductase [Phytoactinopolyspora halophila]
MDSTSSVVIVGGGLAGAKAAETLRDEGFEGRIVLLAAEAEPPYERPPLSKGYLLGTDERAQAFVHPKQWYVEHDVDLRLSTPATAVHRDDHEVEIAGGERVHYDKLLLATGSTPRRLDVPGVELESVHYLRELADADHLLDILDPPHRLVVVGGGWIGLEVAAAARTADVDVTLVETAELPLQGALGNDAARVFADLHREHGVDLRLGSSVQEVIGDDGRVVAVRTDTGDEIMADTVVVGIGARPLVDLAEAAGLDVDGHGGGVLVDAGLRSSDEDIYAAGDIASVDHPVLGDRVRVEHWANALDSGPAAARSMLGHEVSYDRLPFFFTDQYDLGMEYIGYAPPGAYDDVVFRGDVEGRAFHAFWLSGGRVRAGMHVNLWDEGIGPVEELVRSGRTVDPSRLTDTDVPLHHM